MTITVPHAGELLGIGRDAAYAAVANGEIPSLHLGRRIVVPTAKLLALLGVEQ
ncbi:helix-turn-helix domain-containing protein [Microbacterium capsulatum]|uniref:Helix-turn-helix domain-containing protein n=1 Tax=Microbacterium capsulatum TaxID=3041921 RepID=A0ABU0XF85_9MICO|nr:helix-turn-helix domain-containing protein [Microbacterium sp. ASV81]MDQ4213779.1 helix-turn-helix domain-containing protein [Microbacterium sp. ASV81]